MEEEDVILSMLLEGFASTSTLRHVHNNLEVATHALVDVAAMGAALVEEDSGIPVRIERYVEDVVHFYPDSEFKAHFRMQRSSFEELCQLIAPLLVRERSMTVEKKLMSTLWILANEESYRSVADRFGISKGTLHWTVMVTCKALAAKSSEYITFPETQRDLAAISDEFKEQCGMPGVVGAIGATHIPIPAPASGHRSSRRGFSNMFVHVVSDSRLRFLDCYTCSPGPVHDASVYSNSPVADKIKSLPHDYHVLGDSAYPLSSHLLVPYRDNGHLDAVQKKFNKSHSSTKVYVQKAIGLLKCKFRRLNHLHMSRQEEIPVVITVCCFLHNFILQKEGDVLEEIQIDEIDIGTLENASDSTSVSVNGKVKRQSIACLLY